MLNETYRAMLNNKSVIRETFMYGRQRAAQIGSENAHFLLLHCNSVLY